MHVYRWDLDRTYLDTDIHSVRSMIRAAFETASDKRNIPGSGALLRGLLRTDPTARVGIVSGSPTQLRSVLEKKLALDGVRFDHLVLKDHVGNLRRGRLRAVYSQLGYKLPALLDQRKGLGPAVRETCFGDDTEVDAVVYALYAEALAGRASNDTVARVLAAGGAYDDGIELALQALRKVARGDCVDDIFIHVDKGVPLRDFHRLGSRVIPVFSWFQAAMILRIRDRLDPEGLCDVVEVMREGDSFTDHHFAGWTQDLVRRHLIDDDTARQVVHELPESTSLAAERALDRIGPLGPAPVAVRTPDFLGFLDAIR